MRNILISLMLLCSIAMASNVVSFDNNWGEQHMFNIVNETPTGMEIIFSAHTIVEEDIIVDGVPMKTYGIPGVFLPNDQGAPNLQGTGRYIAIPQGAHAQVTVLGTRTETYHDVEVGPAPNIPLEIDDSPLRYVKDMAIYNSNSYYPDTPVQVSDPTAIRGVDVVMLGITPFQYNPVTKDLIVYKDLRIKVDFIGGNGHFGDDRLRSRFWDPVLQGMLLNFNSLPEIDFYSPERINRQTGYEYIIIVPDDANFIPWGDTVKAWRKKQGISCEVFTLTQVGGNTTTAIENFLNNAYNTWNPAPVAFLLLSDYQSSGDAYGITSPTHSYYGYTCVADNKYADVNGNNLPDMHHSRICAQNTGHLSIMINKFLDYERNPYTSTNFYDNPLVACAWQTERWFQLCGEVVRGFFISSLGKNPARQYAIYSGSPYVGSPWSTATNTATVVNYFSNLGYIPTTNQNNSTWWNNGSPTGITNAINSGAFLVQHRDHGMVSGWGEPYYTTSHLASLTNTEHTFVMSTNCLTGKYNYGSQSFTERFHRMSYGALSVNAASEVSFSFVNDVYVWGMYDCMWQQFMPDYPAAEMTPYGTMHPCMAMTYGKYFLSTSSWPYNSGSKIPTYMLFHHHGDCFDVVYDEIPLNLTISHASSLPGGQVYFTVTANDSSVIALTVDNEIIGVGEGTGSPVNVDILPQSDGDTVLVTVTKAGFYRYEALVAVIGGGQNMPNIILTNTSVVGGNGNGELEPGESAGIVCEIANVGSAPATNTNGTLRSSDSYITITDSTTSYGTLNVADTVDNTSDPFDVTVSGSCPPGHSLDFDLYIVAAESSWTRSFSLIVGGVVPQDYATHDCGDCKLTVTRYGAIGFMSSAGTQGSGFWYPFTNTNHLFYSSFAFGTDASWCVDQYYEDAGGDDADWETTTSPNGMVYMYEPGPDNRDEYATARYTDAGHTSPRDLLCLQESWAWDDPTADDFVIMKFSLINNGASAINNAYAAVFVDWDIGNATNNQGSSEGARNLTWMYESSPYVGVAILDPPRSTPAVNLALIDHDVYVYPNSGLPDNIQIQFMDGTIQNASSNRPYDWSTCNSAGPFTIASGAAEIAAFAIVGGNNLSQLQEHADTAYNRYWNWPGVKEEQSTQSFTGIQLYPVISRGPFTIQYGFATKTHVRASVYDALGRLVEHHDYGKVTGTGDLSLSFRSLAQGVYFVKIDAGEQTRTTKVIWVK